MLCEYNSCSFLLVGSCHYSSKLNFLRHFRIVFSYHLQIRSKAQTTNEQVRGVFLAPDATNPFDQGCWQNYASVCCSAVPPSKVLPLTRVHTVSDYVKAHIDPNKHPDIYTLYHHDNYESPP
jgi:hypothetical protein